MNFPPMPNCLRLLPVALAAGLFITPRIRAQDGDAPINPVSPAANPVLAATANTEQTAPTYSAFPNLPSASGAYVLRSGDVVSIFVYRQPDLAVTARVSEAGEITYPLLGQVKVAGLGAFAAQEVIRKKLDADYLVNPQVSLSVLQQAKEYFTVMGEVARPGIYELPAEGGLNLLQSIGMAGGFTHTAKYTAVQVKRSGEGKEAVFKVDVRKLANSGTQEDYLIQPGDVIIVPQSIF